MKEIQDHSASMTFALGVAFKAFNLSFPSLRKPRKSLDSLSLCLPAWIFPKSEVGCKNDK